MERPHRVSPFKLIESTLLFISMQFPSRIRYSLSLIGSALLALCLLAPTRTAAHVHGDEPLAHEMVDAARNFINSLDGSQRRKAMFEFDDPYRVQWDFLPVAMISRKGVALTTLSDRQKRLAYQLLESSVSKSGYEKLGDIIDLERVLFELTGSDIRVPELYHVVLYGEPSDHGTWGWRFEGHHISLHFTIVDGEQIAVAPRFLGTNPAHVKEGDRKGLRVLGEEEDLARELMKSFDERQQRLAHFQSIAYPEIVTNRATEVGPLAPVGIRAAHMYSFQKALLEKLIYTYAATMSLELAKKRLQKIQDNGFGEIRFGWAGGIEPGEPHYYRIQGPTFLIEYDNVQNKANHAHTVWRDFNGDFGRDILKEHYLNHGH